MNENTYINVSGLSRLYQTEEFSSTKQTNFPAKKKNGKLKPLGFCAYCGAPDNGSASELKLTSEHIIPEFLGAGLELPRSSCAHCQINTSFVEERIARHLFDPVRKEFALEGKNGVLEKTNFPLDIGRLNSKKEYVPIANYPTMLALPRLYPAATFSNRAIGATDVYGLTLRNINANREKLKRLKLEHFSTQHIDTVLLSQLLAKIACCYAAHCLREPLDSTDIAAFVRRRIEDTDEVSDHFTHVGGILSPENESDALHELEFGTLRWSETNWYTVRIQLFASLGMPSYFVTVKAKT